MSGGEFEYIQNRMDAVIEQMAEYVDAGNYDQHIITRFARVQEVMQLARGLTHEMDLFLSGDTGEDTFMRQSDKIVDDL